VSLKQRSAVCRANAAAAFHPVNRENTMGADIYLKSVMEPFYENHEAPPVASATDAENAFDWLRSSGGYFRNGYNAGDIMSAMGLSWPDTVIPMLDSVAIADGVTERQLPIERARELLAMIEDRPLTKERLTAHYFENMCNGVEQHPLTGPLMKLANEARAEATGEDSAKLAPPDFDYLAAFLRKRREALLVILRKSIDLGEPLVCSL
jgi:hypothetical protein